MRHTYMTTDTLADGEVLTLSFPPQYIGAITVEDGTRFSLLERMVPLRVKYSLLDGAIFKGMSARQAVGKRNHLLGGKRIYMYIPEPSERSRNLECRASIEDPSAPTAAFFSVLARRLDPPYAPPTCLGVSYLEVEGVGVVPVLLMLASVDSIPPHVTLTIPNPPSDGLANVVTYIPAAFRPVPEVGDDRVIGKGITKPWTTLGRAAKTAIKVRVAIDRKSADELVLAMSSRRESMSATFSTTILDYGSSLISRVCPVIDWKVESVGERSTSVLSFTAMISGASAEDIAKLSTARPSTAGIRVTYTDEASGTYRSVKSPAYRSFTGTELNGYIRIVMYSEVHDETQV